MVTGQNYHLQYHRSIYYYHHCLRLLLFMTFLSDLFCFEGIGFGSYHSFGTFAKLSEKLTLLPPTYLFVCERTK